jgi:hypothetical protein
MDRHLIKWPNSSQLVLNPLSIKTHVLHIPLTVNYRASRAWAEHLYFMEGTGIRDPEIDLFCNRFNLLLDEPKKLRVLIDPMVNQPSTCTSKTHITQGYTRHDLLWWEN